MARKSIMELKNNYLKKYTIGLMMKGKGTSLLRTELTCDLCGETYAAWDVHQVPYNEEGKLAENYKPGEVMMACKKCIEDKKIIKMDTDISDHFDASNLAIKELIETKKADA